MDPCHCHRHRNHHHLNRRWCHDACHDVDDGDAPQQSIPVQTGHMFRLLWQKGEK